MNIAKKIIRCRLIEIFVKKGRPVNRIPVKKTSSAIDFSSANRRDFMKTLLLMGSVPLLAKRGLWAAKGPSKFEYKFATLPVARFPEIQEDVDKLRRENKLSRNATYLSYIDPKRRNFAVPENFKNAKTLIVMAIAQPVLTVDFHHRGRVLPVILPPGYYDDGNSLDDIMKTVREDIVRDPAARVEITGAPHMKLAAVRSGLGKYGRNNICFVDGMGSFLALYAFLTDRPFTEDHWSPLTMLPVCKDCSICYGACPTGAITRENFVIDVGKCVTLYNEVPGEFPNFILPSMHNALMGCLKCQDKCPENEKFISAKVKLEDVTEEETEKILKGTPDDALLKSMGCKLKGFGGSKEGFPVFTRNLQPLLR
jgi:epoxyqueuosine reductase